MQLLSLERSLSQYTIGRGSTRLTERLTSRKRASTAPSGALSPLAEEPPAKLNDWRQRFVEVHSLSLPLQPSCLGCQGVGTPQAKLACSPACRAVAAHRTDSLSAPTGLAASASPVV